MFVSDNHQVIGGSLKPLVFILFTIVTQSPASVFAQEIPLGKPASDREISGWDIDIRPDGKGLPAGGGDAIAGEEVFIEKCASCHGEFAEGVGRYPALAGGAGSLGSHDPVKTVGSYWPHSTTVFDYIRRAMPYGHAQSLSDNDVYAMTAYILYSSDIIEDDYLINQETLPLVEMPNRDGFIQDTRSDEKNSEPCMKNCLPAPPIITGKAIQVDVTPDKVIEVQENSTARFPSSNSASGQKIYESQCLLCHSLVASDHKVGPSLYAVIGRSAGSAEDFYNYSGSMKSSQLVWTKDNLGKFLSDPQAFLPGTTMPFIGIKDPEQLNDLLIYLEID